ncbi:hypothetical protein TGVEG_208400 [Toxoplasma gondii VEG]|uniref:Uncharacterized protein n=1 Tax=Toxoplasma gondii (strain ATCC 50861 / VEG) TaxID=432359 RepID=V4YM72_TOXGV|nr:hypothetical protein TGVEG_208400 [Toxoplasma gondii VEG]
MEAVCAIHELFSSCRGDSWPFVSVQAIKQLVKHHLRQTAALDDEELESVLRKAFPESDKCHGEVDFLSFWKGMEALLAALGLQQATVAGDIRLECMQFFRDRVLSLAEEKRGGRQAAEREKKKSRSGDSKRAELCLPLGAVVLTKQEILEVVRETGRRRLGGISARRRTGSFETKWGSGDPETELFWEQVYSDASRIDDGAGVSVVDLSAMVFDFLHAYVEQSRHEAREEDPSEPEGERSGRFDRYARTVSEDEMERTESRITTLSAPTSGEAEERGRDREEERAGGGGGGGGEEGEDEEPGEEDMTSRRRVRRKHLGRANRGGHVLAEMRGGKFDEQIEVSRGESEDDRDYAESGDEGGESFHESSQAFDEYRSSSASASFSGRKWRGEVKREDVDFSRARTWGQGTSFASSVRHSRTQSAPSYSLEANHRPFLRPVPESPSRSRSSSVCAPASSSPSFLGSRASEASNAASPASYSPTASPPASPASPCSSFAFSPSSSSFSASSSASFSASSSASFSASSSTSFSAVAGRGESRRRGQKNLEGDTALGQVSSVLSRSQQDSTDSEAEPGEKTGTNEFHSPTFGSEKYLSGVEARARPEYSGERGEKTGSGVEEQNNHSEETDARRREHKSVKPQTPSRLNACDRNFFDAPPWAEGEHAEQGEEARDRGDREAEEGREEMEAEAGKEEGEEEREEGEKEREEGEERREVGEEEREEGERAEEMREAGEAEEAGGIEMNEGRSDIAHDFPLSLGHPRDGEEESGEEMHGSPRRVLASQLGEALLRLQETCAVSLGRSRETEPATQLKNSRKFVEAALEAFDRLQTQAVQTEEELNTVKRSASRLRREKCQLLERLRRIETKVDDAAEDAPEIETLRERLLYFQDQVETQKRQLSEKEDLLRKATEERDSLQERTASLQRQCTKKVEETTRDTQQRLQQQEDELRALKEEKAALEEELWCTAERLRLSQAASVAAATPRQEGRRVSDASQDGDSACTLRIQLQELQDLRQSMELEVEAKDALIHRLQRQTEELQQKILDLDVKLRQASGLVLQLRRARDDLLNTHEKWRKDATRQREKLLNAFQAAAASSDTLFSNARSSATLTEAVVASADERMTLLQKDQEICRLQDTLAATQGHIRQLEQFIDGMRRERQPSRPASKLALSPDFSFRPRAASPASLASSLRSDLSLSSLNTLSGAPQRPAVVARRGPGPREGDRGKARGNGDEEERENGEEQKEENEDEEERENGEEQKAENKDEEERESSHGRAASLSNEPSRSSSTLEQRKDGEEWGDKDQRGEERRREETKETGDGEHGQGSLGTLEVTNETMRSVADSANEIEETEQKEATDVGSLCKSAVASASLRPATEGKRETFQTGFEADELGDTLQPSVSSNSTATSRSFPLSVEKIGIVGEASLVSPFAGEAPASAGSAGALGKETQPPAAMRQSPTSASDGFTRDISTKDLPGQLDEARDTEETRHAPENSGEGEGAGGEKEETTGDAEGGMETRVSEEGPVAVIASPGRLTGETLRALDKEEGEERFEFRKKRKLKLKRDEWDLSQSGSNSSYTSFLVDVSVAGSEDEGVASLRRHAVPLSPALSRLSIETHGSGPLTHLNRRERAKRREKKTPRASDFVSASTATLPTHPRDDSGKPSSRSDVTSSDNDEPKARKSKNALFSALGLSRHPVTGSRGQEKREKEGRERLEPGGEDGEGGGLGRRSKSQRRLEGLTSQASLRRGHLTRDSLRSSENEEEKERRHAQVGQREAEGANARRMRCAAPDAARKVKDVRKKQKDGDAEDDRVSIRSVPAEWRTQRLDSRRSSVKSAEFVSFRAHLSSPSLPRLASGMPPLSAGGSLPPHLSSAASSHGVSGGPGERRTLGLPRAYAPLSSFRSEGAEKREAEESQASAPSQKRLSRLSSKMSDFFQDTQRANSAELSHVPTFASRSLSRDFLGGPSAAEAAPSGLRLSSGTSVGVHVLSSPKTPESSGSAAPRSVSRSLASSSLSVSSPSSKGSAFFFAEEGTTGNSMHPALPGGTHDTCDASPSLSLSPSLKALSEKPVVRLERRS